MRFALFATALLLLAGCGGDAAPPANADAPSSAIAIRVGAEVLADDGFARLQGRRVGLIANHTALADSTHLIDLLHAAPDVTLAALFGPEHGLRGTADAGAKVADGRDAQTGVPIYSLYGERRAPDTAVLDDLDVLVFDIQDIGARFYTYISTMGLAMQAAADAGIPFLVLDRPNPLGARTSGYVLDPAEESFVGLYPIPIQHGMTVGELARMIQGEAWLPGLDSLQLEVIAVDGWPRETLWPALERAWIATSPNIPDFETALLYPGTCFFEATAASEGRGTYEPFKLLGAPWADGAALADTLTARGLPGIAVEAATFTPEPIEGMSSSPKLAGETLSGVRLGVTDAAAVRPVEAGIHVLHAFYDQHRRLGLDEASFWQRAAWLTRLAGTPRLLEGLRAGDRPEALIQAWQEEVARFDAQRAPYLLYPAER